MTVYVLAEYRDRKDTKKWHKAGLVRSCYQDKDGEWKVVQQPFCFLHLVGIEACDCEGWYYHIPLEEGNYKDAYVHELLGACRGIKLEFLSGVGPIYKKSLRGFPKDVSLEVKKILYPTVLHSYLSLDQLNHYDWSQQYQGKTHAELAGDFYSRTLSELKKLSDMYGGAHNVRIVYGFG